MGDYQGIVNGLLQIEKWLIWLGTYLYPIPPNRFDTYVFKFFGVLYILKKENSASCQFIIISCFILRKTPVATLHSSSSWCIVCHFARLTWLHFFVFGLKVGGRTHHGRNLGQAFSIKKKTRFFEKTKNIKKPVILPFSTGFSTWALKECSHQLTWRWLGVETGEFSLGRRRCRRGASSMSGAVQEGGGAC